jgi:hypothetical protein
MPFWVFGAYLFWRLAKNQKILKDQFWVIPVSMLGMFMGHSLVILLAFQFNPFA